MNKTLAVLGGVGLSLIVILWMSATSVATIYGVQALVSRTMTHSGFLHASKEVDLICIRSCGGNWHVGSRFEGGQLKCRCDPGEKAKTTKKTKKGKK